MTKKTTRKNQTKKKSPKTILLTCVALVLAVAGINQVWKGATTDTLPSDTSVGRTSTISSERNQLYAQQDAAKQREEEQRRLNDTDAPDEGLSRAAYENLEQPAPISDLNEVLLFKKQFIVSYSLKHLCPNYVCWSLTRERAESEECKRSDRFEEDIVISERSRVQTSDYSNSGYDRGHMCPAADNRNDADAMRQSFFMTNICPQSHSLNAGAWKELEEFCRSWASDYGTLYICCGPIFDKAKPKTIGNRKGIKISVPDRFFKVLLYMGREPKAIGFIYANERCTKDIRDYAVSVDEVEKITGLDFFHQLDDKTEKAVEGRCKPAEWGL